MVTRSSLELMLDKLQQIEEKPGDDAPPALPVRPVSRARLPRPRQPLQLRSSHRNAGFEMGRTEGEDFAKSKMQESGNLKGSREKQICKIQKCYRGHRIRCYYGELRRGVIARFSSAGNLDPRHHDQIKLNSESIEDQTSVPYTSLVDLQKRVMRTEAKLRAKKEENFALKRKLDEMEKKWQKREERMTFMEKEWQDQLTHIQETLAAATRNPSPEPRFSNRFQNCDNSTVKPGVGRLHIPMNANDNGMDEEDDEVVEEQVVCLKVRPREELEKLKVRFKEWKKEYKQKLRDAQSSMKKLGNPAETSENRKKWWGRRSRLSN